MDTAVTRQMLRLKGSPARVSADNLPVFRGSPRLKVSKARTFVQRYTQGQADNSLGTTQLVAGVNQGHWPAAADANDVVMSPFLVLDNLTANASKRFLVISESCDCRKQSKSSSFRHEVNGVITTCGMHECGL